MHGTQPPCPALPALHRSLRGGSVAAVRFLPNSLDVAEAIFPRRTLTLDWQQTYEGSTFSVAATLPPEVPWTAVSQAVVYCENCAGFTGVLARARLPQAGGGASDGGASGEGTVAFVFQNAQLAPAGAQQPQQGAALQSQMPLAAAGAPAGGASGRRLQQQQQEPPPDCSLQVGDQTLRFERCQTVPMKPYALYQCFCTLEPGGSQGGSRWRGGLRIDAAGVGGQWGG